MRRIAWLLFLSSAALYSQRADTEKLAPYYPTPETIVMKMLQLGGLKAGEKVYDLGSGDGATAGIGDGSPQRGARLSPGCTG